jgi:hypothetical protein
MESQPNLFDLPSIGSHRRADPDTSKKAARSVDVNHLQNMCLIALRTWGNLTTEEISVRLNVPPVSVSPRMAPLVRKGNVRDSGKRGVNASGRKAILWEAV